MKRTTTSIQADEVAVLFIVVGIAVFTSAIIYSVSIKKNIDIASYSQS